MSSTKSYPLLRAAALSMSVDSGGGYPGIEKDVAAAFDEALTVVPGEDMAVAEAFLASLTDDEREIVLCGLDITEPDGPRRVTDEESGIVVEVPPTPDRVISWLFDHGEDEVYGA